jgi:hypothetical protein
VKAQRALVAVWRSALHDEHAFVENQHLLSALRMKCRVVPPRAQQVKVA